MLGFAYVILDFHSFWLSFSPFFLWRDFNLLVLLGSLMLFSRYIVSSSFATPWTVACQAPLCSWDFPGKNTGVVCHFFTQGSNPCLLHWQADSSLLSHQGSPLLGKQINRKKQVTCKFSDILKMQVNDRGLWSWLCNGRGRVPLCPLVSPTVAHSSQLEMLEVSPKAQLFSRGWEPAWLWVVSERPGHREIIWNKVQGPCCWSGHTDQSLLASWFSLWSLPGSC